MDADEKHDPTKDFDDVDIAEKAAPAPLVADGDEALQAHSEGIVVTDEDNRRILRKIDWHLQPFLIAVYGIQCTTSLPRLLEPETLIGPSRSRQDDPVVCHPARHLPRHGYLEGPVQHNLQRLLYRLFGLLVPHQPAAPALAARQVLWRQHRRLGGGPQPAGRLPELFRPLRRPLVPRHVRGLGHARIRAHRQPVLQEGGAGQPHRLVVLRKRPRPDVSRALVRERRC